MRKSALKLPATLIVATLCVTPRLLAAERQWTRSEVLALADEEARRSGYDPELTGICLSVYTTGWESYSKSLQESAHILEGREHDARLQAYREKIESHRRLMERLNGRQYWAVQYPPLTASRKGLGLYVFIDRETGEVIGSWNDH